MSALAWKFCMLNNVFFSSLQVEITDEFCKKVSKEIKHVERCISQWMILQCAWIYSGTVHCISISTTITKNIVEIFDIVFFALYFLLWVCAVSISLMNLNPRVTIFDICIYYQILPFLLNNTLKSRNYVHCTSIYISMYNTYIYCTYNTLIKVMYEYE